MSHSGHKIVRCRLCHKVIFQCRCLSLTKPSVLADEPCDSCKRSKEQAMENCKNPSLHASGQCGCFGLSTHEPPPVESLHPAIYDLLRKDMDDRDKYGLNKYGKRLRPYNGRNALKDAYQEVLDLAVYLRQRLYEEENPIVQHVEKEDSDQTPLQLPSGKVVESAIKTYARDAIECLVRGDVPGALDKLRSAINHQ